MRLTRSAGASCSPGPCVAWCCRGRRRVARSRWVAGPRSVWFWPVVYHQRLWWPQPRRPLAWVVGPPWDQAWMWSPWQRWEGTKQVSCSQRRCTMSRHAAQGAPERSGGADVADAVGPVGHHSLDERFVVAQQFGHRAGGDDGARGEFADAADEGVEVDHDGDEGGGAFGVGGGGHGPGGHLDEGVVAALGGGAGQMARGGVVAMDLLGGGPVLGEQVAFDPFQRRVDGGGGEGGEVAVGVADAVEADPDAEPAQVAVAAVAVFGPVGVGGVAPVGAQPFPVVEAQAAPLGDQVLFAVGEVPPGPGVTGQAGQHPHMGGGQVPGPERGPGVGHGPQPAGVAHLTRHLRARQAGVHRDPIRGVAGPITRVHLPGLEHRGQLGHHRRQPGLLPAQAQHRLAQLGIGHGVAVHREHVLDHPSERRGEPADRRRPGGRRPDRCGHGLVGTNICSYPSTRTPR